MILADDPVLIVGAGPTGLVLAIALARRGIPFRLIDRHPEPLRWDRATVIKSRTLEIFDNFGLADAFVERGAVVRSVRLFADGRAAPPISFDDIDSRFPFMLSLPEHETERILTEQLMSLGGRVERGMELVALDHGESGVYAGLRDLEDGRETTQRACWLVGTDGLHSIVRRSVDDAFEGHDNPSLWCVVDAHIDGWELPGNAIFAQMEAPAVNPIPLRDGRWRMYVRPDAESDNILAQVDAGLAAMSPGAAMRDPDTPRYFHTQSRVANRYRVGRVLLAGDAAHACSPIQAHGMNTGIHDAHNLGWKLALVASGVAPEAVLDTYEMERQPVAQSVVQSGDETESRARLALHDRALRMSMMEKLQAPEMRYAAALDEAEIAYRYQPNTIVGTDQARAEGATFVGARVGDADGISSSVGAVRLHDLMRGPEYDLFILLGGDAATIEQGRALAKAATEGYRPHLRSRVVTRIKPDGSDPIDFLSDPTGSLHDRLAGDGPTMALIRPDGHLGYRGALSLEDLHAHLEPVIRPV